MLRVMTEKMKVAVVQMLVGGDKAANLRHAVSKIGDAHEKGAKLIILPVN